MSDGVDFSIVGVEALEAKLESIDDDMRYKGGRFALRKGANIVANKAKQGASRIDDPKTASDIESNIAVRWSGKFFKATGDLKFRVGVMGGAGGNKTSEYYDGLPGKDTRHWRHQEFGTENHKATPFMRPAGQNSTHEVLNEFATQYEKSIDRALKRAAKKKS